MSLQEIERVTQRALRDEAFRALLQVNPGAALAEYELTAAERVLLLGQSAPAAESGPGGSPTEPPQ
jgi:hypothetical protein